MNREILKMLEEEERFYNSASDSDQYIREGINISKRIVQEVTEEHNNRWTPCSERLPERNKNVLCWVKSKTISGTETYIIGSCDNGFWFLKTYEIDRESFPVKDYKVIAWRPLPDPYKERESDE